jgi:hypothetical protein
VTCGVEIGRYISEIHQWPSCFIREGCIISTYPTKPCYNYLQVYFLETHFEAKVMPALDRIPFDSMEGRFGVLEGCHARRNCTVVLTASSRIEDGT